MPAEETGEILKWLLGIAWLAPLAGFAIEVFAGFWSSRLSKAAAYLAVGCIGLGFVCSTWALIHWGKQMNWAALQPAGHHAGPADHHQAKQAATQVSVHLPAESPDPGDTAADDALDHPRVRRAPEHHLLLQLNDCVDQPSRPRQQRQLAVGLNEE